jgi:hypothetical protein
MLAVEGPGRETEARTNVFADKSQKHSRVSDLRTKVCREYMLVSV